MNTRSHSLELVVTPAQVLEVTKALFHTILFHRTAGKYSYTSPHSGTFSVGTVGVEDVDCSTVEYTYVRSSSPELDQCITREIEGFSSLLCQQDSARLGKLTLEFYERKKGRWLLPSETVNWEVWHLQLRVIQPASEEEWQVHQQRLIDTLSEKVLYIAEVVNRPDYVPRNPTFDSLANVFDVRFPQVQPYLHRITYELGATESVAGTVKKFFRDTFTYS